AISSWMTIRMGSNLGVVIVAPPSSQVPPGRDEGVDQAAGDERKGEEVDRPRKAVLRQPLHDADHENGRDQENDEERELGREATGAALPKPGEHDGDPDRGEAGEAEEGGEGGRGGHGLEFEILSTRSETNSKIKTGKCQKWVVRSSGHFPS